MARTEFTPHSRHEHRPAARPSNGDSLSRRGRSGYGVESIRPLLRAQIAQRDLVRPPFPPPEDTTDDPQA